MAYNPQTPALTFKNYIQDKKILIADENATSRAGLAKILIEMGAKNHNVTMVSQFEVAEEVIRTTQPHVVFCDYMIGKRCGLDLIQKQRAQRPASKECLFILVTGNTSQSAVAQAAEEDVDTFILKPYTVESLRRSILKAVESKMNPDEYMLAIESGKATLEAGKYEEASQVFNKAKTLNPRPALACFYIGQIELLKKTMNKAADSYSQGLAFNKIHYKCLIGLHDAYMQGQKYAEAYELVKRMSRYFPANPQRLTSVLRLAVMTNSYDDIERYYQIFVNLDDRNEEMVKYICAALVVCGKFYLQKNFGSRALELFKKAAATASGRTRIIREIILALVSSNLIKDASEFIKKFPVDTMKTPDFYACELLVMDRTQPLTKTIDRGQEHIKNQVHDPLIYKILIPRLMEVGNGASAESLKISAIKQWPAQKKEFDALSIKKAA